MKNSNKNNQSYLNHTVNADDAELISVIDELPLWSAPFGLKLLDAIKMKSGMKVLDVGSGFGFPLIEIANRLGDSCSVVGIDPWSKALDRIRFKIKKYDLKNVDVVEGVAEKLPFDDKSFDLIVSNNGINNVQDMDEALRECARVSKTDGQLVFTVNLEDTMIEFYEIFYEVLRVNAFRREADKLKKHIYSKRKPLDEIKAKLQKSGFVIVKIVEDAFRMRFLNASTLFNHYLIKYWFLDSWKIILNEEDMNEIFLQLEKSLNKVVKENGEINLTIPFVTINCRKG